MNELQKAQSEIAEAQAKLNAAQARIEELGKPVEREYRAGEWVPVIGDRYYVVGTSGKIVKAYANNGTKTSHRLKSGNAFPTEAIAEAAKEHADWWRKFDLIRYEAVGETGRAEMNLGRIEYTIPTLHIGSISIERLGGEQKVIEMLNKGRVFKFKWGGQ